MNYPRTSIPSLLLGILFCVNAFAQSESPMMQKSQAGQPLSEPISSDLCTPEGIAVGGFDVLSYRQDSGPIPGLRDFAIDHNGLTYLFADESNRTEFSDSPERYLPEYDGFCAITLALGRISCPQYNNFKIEDDRLLLFEITGFTNGRTLWNSDPADFRQKADKNFTKISE